MTNLEGRVLLRRAALPPPPGVRTRPGGAERARRPARSRKGFPADPDEVFEELRRASAGGPADYSGITYARIAAEDGVFWPCPDRATHPGTPRLFLDRFATDDGRARFIAVSHRPAAEEPDADFPVYLTTGRVLAQYQSGAQTRRVPELNAAAPGPFVELHPRLADRIGAVEGEPLAVTSRRAAPWRRPASPRRSAPTRSSCPSTGRAPAAPTPLPIRRWIRLPRMPEFKVCAVRVERAG